MRCWICTKDKILFPYKSNPKGIMSGRIVMICTDCKKRVDKRPTRPWEKE